MGEPTSSPGAPPPGHPTPSMLSIYLQRSASAQLGQQGTSPRPPGLQPSPRQPAQAIPGPPQGSSAPEPGPTRWPFAGQPQHQSGWPGSQPLLSVMPASPAAALSNSPFAVALGSSSLPTLRSSSQPALSQGSVAISPGSSQLPRPPVAFSPSRSSFGSGFSMQSGAGEEESGGAAAGGGSGGSRAAEGPGASFGYGAPGPSGSQPPHAFAGITDEEIAAMDPKRAKRLIANRQSAQRSKARKLRHIMQLEDEVQKLQGINQQQLATISGLQQESSLLSAANRQLGMQVGELQEALRKQEAFTEMVIAELRRLSNIAGEPAQLPAFPPSLQEQQVPVPGPQMCPQLAADMALQQQLATQYGFSNIGLMGGFGQYAPVLAAGVQQQLQPIYQQQLGMQLPACQAQLPQQLPGSFYPQQQQQQHQVRQQRPQQPRPQQRGGPRPQGSPPQPPQLQERQTRLPQPGERPPGPQGHMPQRLASQSSLDALAASAAPQQAGGPSAGGPTAGDASRSEELPGMAERRSVRFSSDTQQAAAEAAATESRRQALATAGRGSTFPLGQGKAARSAALRTLSVPLRLDVATAAVAAAEAEAAQQLQQQLSGELPQPQGQGQLQLPPQAAAQTPPAQQQAASRRQDPFRVNVPPSAFQLEERRSSSSDVHGRRQQQQQQLLQAQQFVPVPEQEGVQEWQQQVAWPLGPRAQQPYPAAAGQVMQAFRGLTLQGSDPTGYPGAGLTPRVASQLPGVAPGPGFTNLSWDEMMRSLSDPVFQTGEDVLPPNFYPEAAGFSRQSFESFYNVAQQQQQQQQQQEQQQQPPPPGDESAR